MYFVNNSAYISYFVFYIRSHASSNSEIRKKYITVYKIQNAHVNTDVYIYYKYVSVMIICYSRILFAHNWIGGRETIKERWVGSRVCVYIHACMRVCVNARVAV